jgi:hypothetical protein
MTFALTPEASATQSEGTKTMPNGTWMIKSTPPADAVKLCDEYLPTGTTLRLVAEGPTRRAIEEDINNELGGTLTLLSPVTPAICSVGLGAATSFGLNLCERGNASGQTHTPLVFTDAIFVFSRLDAAAAENPENFFYTQMGARSGARFARVLLKYKAVEWELWLRSANEMVSRCVADLPGKDKVVSFPMIWRRQPD